MDSRSTSPMRGKGDSASPDGQKDTGLAVNIVILRVRERPRSASWE